MPFFHLYTCQPSRYQPSHKSSSWYIVAMLFITAVAISSTATAHAKASDNQPIIGKNVLADKVFVDKSARVLRLMNGETIIKSYHIALGDSPQGHKRQQGDERTPTGAYTLDYKNEQSKYYRSIHVSYPNAADKAYAKKRGVDPGGDIMIHGQKNGAGHLAAITQKRDWTDGCIAVTDDEMDEIMAVVDVGTAIEIVE